MKNIYYTPFSFFETGFKAFSFCGISKNFPLSIDLRLLRARITSLTTRKARMTRLPSFERAERRQRAKQADGFSRGPVFPWREYHQELLFPRLVFSLRLISINGSRVSPRVSAILRSSTPSNVSSNIIFFEERIFEWNNR